LSQNLDKSAYFIYNLDCEYRHKERRLARVLVLGKDGRTDSLAWALSASGAIVFSMCDYNNPGLMKRSKEFRKGKTDDVAQVISFAREIHPDLVVVGPEEPLAAGVVDELQRQLAIPSVGPTKALAQLESSKSFTRRLLTQYNVSGNVEYRIFESLNGLEEYLRRLVEFVVKPDGLTGGKGVKVFGEHLFSVEEGLAYARNLLKSGPVVIEEKLDGEEFSLQSFCDGDTVIHTIPVQDHKRAEEGDSGPNTGGMGSYSCEDHLLPFLTAEHVKAAGEINTAVARALHHKLGQPYKGILYGGFMLTGQGLRLIEYNARFGDPEAMNVLPLLETNFLSICEAITSGHLGRMQVTFKKKATVCKYVVPNGYPLDPRRDVAIDMNRIPESSDCLKVYYAAVHQQDHKVVLTGSRAIAFVGLGDSLKEAESIAEAAASCIDGPDVRHRRDVGTEAVIQKRIDHMRRLSKSAVSK
jgi:phosphoribosylamine--glycine ligase